MLSKSSFRASSELLSIQWRSSIAMMTCRSSAPLRVIRFQGFQGSVLPGLGTHLNLFYAAVLDREEFQEVGERGCFINLQRLEESCDLFPDRLIGVGILDVKVGSEDIHDGMVGNVPAVGEASALRGK